MVKIDVITTVIILLLKITIRVIQVIGRVPLLSNLKSYLQIVFVEGSTRSQQQNRHFLQPIILKRAGEGCGRQLN